MESKYNGGDLYEVADYQLSALEIDKINSECKELDAEEQAIHNALCSEQ